MSTINSSRAHRGGAPSSFATDFRSRNEALMAQVEAKLDKQREHASMVTAIRVHQGSISDSDDPLAQDMKRLCGEISHLDQAAKRLAGLRGDRNGVATEEGNTCRRNAQTLLEQEMWSPQIQPSSLHPSIRATQKDLQKKRYPTATNNQSMADWNRLQKGLEAFEDQSHGTNGHGPSRSEEDTILDLRQRHDALDDPVHAVMDNEKFQGLEDPDLLSALTERDKEQHALTREVDSRFGERIKEYSQWASEPSNGL